MTIIYEFPSEEGITRPNSALDMSTILCLYVPGFQRQVFKHVKVLSERSKESKEQKKNKRSVLVAETAYNAQNAQFGLVMGDIGPFVSNDIRWLSIKFVL